MAGVKFAILSAIILVAVLLLFRAMHLEAPKAAIALRPKVEPEVVTEVIAATEVVWRKPQDGEPRAIMLLFHGCTHQAGHFFSLPEERILVDRLLKKNFVAMAFSSKNLVGNKCWHNSLNPQKNLDLSGVQEALEAILNREGWTRLPLFAFGASSGGSFATVFPLSRPLEAILVQISPGNEEALEQISPAHVRGVYFSTMVRDKRTTELVENLAPVLQEKGIQTGIFKIKPREITPTYFSQYIPEISEADSRQMFLSLKDHLTMTKTGAFLAKDPRKSKEVVESLAFMKGFEAAIEEELNVLWGTHELSSDDCEVWIDRMLQLLDSPIDR